MSGEVWIDKHSFFVREIEGELEKSPSWWLKQVCIKVLLVQHDCKWLGLLGTVAESRIAKPLYGLPFVVALHVVPLKSLSRKKRIGSVQFMSNNCSIGFHCGLLAATRVPQVVVKTVVG